VEILNLTVEKSFSHSQIFKFSNFNIMKTKEEIPTQEIITISVQTHRNMVKEIKYLRNELKNRPVKVVDPPLWEIALISTTLSCFITIILIIIKSFY